MLNSMNVPKWKFEEEFRSLLNAAKSACSRSTAEAYLKQAKSKIYGYYNIPEYLQQQYLREVEDVADELGISI